jgi:hypothetical protein
LEILQIIFEDSADNGEDWIMLSVISFITSILLQTESNHY